MAAEVDRQRGQDTELVLRRLEPLAVAATAEPPTHRTVAVNTAFLVERARVDDFSDAVQGLAGELGARIQLRFIGPLPPYSFADQEVPASTAWA